MLQGVVNFRDVGGHRALDGRLVRTGRLFRSGHLAHATDDDLRVLEALGVGVVIDFRGPGDLAEEGEDRLPAGARLVSIPMFDPAQGTDIRALLSSSPPEVVAQHFGEGRAFEMMVRAASTFVTNPERVEQFSLMLHTLIDHDGPAIIHCSAGKDRTGWAASLVLLALGVERADVIAHYLESNHHRRDRAGRLAELARAGIDPAVLEPFFGVREEYVLAAVAAVDEHWGGVDAYLRRGLGVDDAGLARFRAAMLEG